jgi:hypothetical protein
MTSKRKQYVVDKKFQYRLSLKITVLPLASILIVWSVVFFFAMRNNGYINEIVRTQDDMIEMFISTPALTDADNPVIKNAEKTFKQNIGHLVLIRNNSRLSLYIIIALAAVQSVFLFALLILISQRISGPIFVMTAYLRDLRKGKNPVFRKLRKKDELQDFYREFTETMEKLSIRED